MQVQPSAGYHTITAIDNNGHQTKKEQPFGYSFPELLTRLELVTSSLPRKCSTTELQQHFTLSSGAKVGNKFESTKKYGLFLQVLSEKYCFPNLYSAK